jgi:hypothetical protein
MIETFVGAVRSSAAAWFGIAPSAVVEGDRIDRAHDKTPTVRNFIPGEAGRLSGVEGNCLSQGSRVQYLYRSMSDWRLKAWIWLGQEQVGA